MKKYIIFLNHIYKINSGIYYSFKFLYIFINFQQTKSR